jgi:hypothetical protein
MPHQAVDPSLLTKFWMMFLSDAVHVPYQMMYIAKAIPITFFEKLTLIDSQLLKFSFLDVIHSLGVGTSYLLN